jgi:hypothetical protein
MSGHRSCGGSPCWGVPSGVSLAAGGTVASALALSAAAVSLEGSDADEASLHDNPGSENVVGPVVAAPVLSVLPRLMSSLPLYRWRPAMRRKVRPQNKSPLLATECPCPTKGLSPCGLLFRVPLQVGGVVAGGSARSSTQINALRSLSLLLRRLNPPAAPLTNHHPARPCIRLRLGTVTHVSRLVTARRASCAACGSSCPRGDSRR